MLSTRVCAAVPRTSVNKRNSYQTTTAGRSVLGGCYLFEKKVVAGSASPLRMARGTVRLPCSKSHPTIVGGSGHSINSGGCESVSAHRALMC